MNNARGTATSAIWNVTALAWRTTFAPILTSPAHRLAEGSIDGLAWHSTASAGPLCVDALPLASHDRYAIVIQTVHN